jgi:lactoylglutathione lyase
MKFCWATVDVRDMEESLRFYSEVVGLPVTRRMRPNPAMELAFLGSGETQIELIWNAKAGAGAGMGSDISLGFVVDSVDGIIETLKKRDIPLHSGPFQPNPSIKFVYVQDPNGLKIQFVENLA